MDQRLPRQLVFAVLLLALALVFGGREVFGQGGPALTVRDAGRLHAFEIAGDEVAVTFRQLPPGQLPNVVRNRLPQATVSQMASGRALVRLPAAIDQQAAAAGQSVVHKALPEMEVQPVIYRAGVPHMEVTRRLVTREVLAQLGAGETPEQLAAAAGGATARPSILPGYVVLTFQTPWRALDAADALHKAGVRADPILEGHWLKPMAAAPNDPFFPGQWHLRNTGQGGGLAGIDANVLPAWDVTRGRDGNGIPVTAVVIDDCLEIKTNLRPGHPDLIPNMPDVNSMLHFDFRDGDDDPSPEPGSQDGHGTSVAGVIAAKANNGIGVSGAAPDAQLLGVRIIGSFVSTSDFAKALYWHPAGGPVVSLSNNSWGPSIETDLSGPSPEEKQALHDAVTFGRGGLGQIILFAGGNGRQTFNGFLNNAAVYTEANSNYDGYANSRYVIGVGACTNLGTQAYYSNDGANLLVCAPSNGGTLGITTTDVTGTDGYNPGPGEPSDDDYTNSFGGTSSATPLTSGGVALMLAANANLGWRDVHEILASTARQIDASDSDWVFNGGGFKFNHKYGGGMVDLGAAVARSVNWKNLGPEISESLTLTSPSVPVAIVEGPAGISRNFDFSGQPNLRVERVEVTIGVTHPHRSDLEISLTSPDGTKSILEAHHTRPDPFYSPDDDTDISDGDTGWTYTTTHDWGENSAGVWTLQARDLVAGGIGSLQSAQVTIHGTASSSQRVTFDQPRYLTAEGAGSFTLRIKRLGVPTGAISVDLGTAGGTAVAGTNFTFAPGPVPFADGEAFKDVTIPLIDGSVTGPFAVANFTLTNPVGASLGGTSLTTVTIVSDSAPTVSVAATDPNALRVKGVPGNLNPPQDTGTLTFSRAVATASAVTVNYTISGTAVNGTDYQTIGSSITIPPSALSADLLITPQSDLFDPRTVTVTINPDVGYFIGTPASATVTLLPDQLTPVTIAALSPSVPENSPTPVYFRVSRGATSSDSLLVTLTVAGSALSGTNYVPIPNLAEIPAGSDHVDIPLQPIDDNTYRASKTVVVLVAPSSLYALGFSKSARIDIIEDDPLPTIDLAKPKVTIASPANHARIPEGTAVMASGTAGDNIGVTSVLYKLNDGNWTAASGTTQWSADLSAAVAPGPNVLSVKSVDAAKNESAVAVRSFDYVVSRTLTVNVGAGGKVSTGFSPSSVREAGQTYTITATPAVGFVFKDWTGDLSSSSRIFTFIMPAADTTLTAAFLSPNPFTAEVTGTYNGLITKTPFAWESSGFFQATVLPQGSFSGGVTLGGAKTAIKGAFDGDGLFSATIARKGKVPLRLDLALDLAPNGTHLLTGIVTSDVISQISAARAAFKAKTAPYPPAPLPAALPANPGYFTAYFAPPDPAVSDKPHGFGYATLAIDASGNVKLTGVLPDGSAISQSVPLSQDFTWPLYLKAYAGKGVMLGTAVLDATQAGSDLHASVNWFKPPRSKDAVFPGGFTVENTAFVGSSYTAPAAGRVLSAFDTSPNNSGSLSFADGNLTQGVIHGEFSAGFTLSVSNQAVFTIPNPQNVTLLVVPKKGIFSGTFIHPLSRNLTHYNGVILQKSQEGAAYFPGSIFGGGTGVSGRVHLLPLP